MHGADCQLTSIADFKIVSELRDFLRSCPGRKVMVIVGGAPLLNPTASLYAANLSGATGWAQHEQRARPAARPTTSSRRNVAIESDT